jgi:2-methylcitrate dehydratase PrpD
MQDERILDPDVLAMTRRVKVAHNPVKGPTQYLPVAVTIKTARGEFRTDVTSLKGSPADPLTWDEIVAERVGRCAPFSAVKLPQSRIDALTSHCRNLAGMDDVRELVRLMHPDKAS